MPFNPSIAAKAYSETLPTSLQDPDSTPLDTDPFGLLYIGKSKSLRGRFSGGHKAFLWSWLDKYNDEDVRLSLYPLSPWEDPALLLELEARILRATEPPYNVLIPPEI